MTLALYTVFLNKPSKLLLFHNGSELQYNILFFSDHPMKDTVLTVPVFFNQAERKALLE